MPEQVFVAIRAALLLCLLGGVSPLFGETVTDRYDDTFRKYSKRFFGPGQDWRIFKAQAMAESNLSMNARSWVGARGLMQLMPRTFKEIQTKNPEFVSVDDPEWNIAAGIFYDAQLWTQWRNEILSDDRKRFMLGSYNAGRMTLLRAQGVARSKNLNHTAWESIRSVAPEVKNWRHGETLGYVDKIEKHFVRMDRNGQVRN